MPKGLTTLLVALLMAIAAGVTHAEIPALIEAAKAQDIAELRLLLDAGADPDARQPDRATALHWAAYHEDDAAAAALIEAGADVDATNRLGASALYLAAKSGNSQLIIQLLQAGANPNVALPMGETPIMTASRAGAARGIEALIQAGANVNAVERSREQTALMWAAAQGHLDVTRLLVDAGADLTLRSKIRPRLMFADASNGGAFDQGIMENLGGYTALLFAAREGNTEIAQLLLDNGADTEALAGNGTSPLVVATHSGHGELARLLLERGADANSIEAGYTALHAAILRGDLTTVKALLAHGGDANTRLVRPNPVQRASEDWVLKTPLVGATPYWIAASFREAEIMNALVEGGADPLLLNDGLKSRPRARADRESYTPTIVGGFQSSVQAAITGDSTRGRFYVQPNPDPAGEEQLALAAVIAAADHGVDLSHRDYNESTAMHDAAARGLPNIVRELAARGVDVNALNGRGQTALDLAIAAENRPNFFGFDTSISGPSASEVLRALGATRSQQ